MKENIILSTFIAIPVFSGLLLFLFHRRRRSLRKNAHSIWRIVRGNALLTLVLFSFALLCGEVYFRFIYDTTESFGLTKVTTKWLKRYYKNNTAGVRDSLEHYVARCTPGMRRFTFIGDSFTAGHGIKNVESRFTNIIRDRKPAWEVHVFSSNGWDTGEELTCLRNLIQLNNYELDLVILIYNLNDIADIVPEWQDNLRRIYGGPEPGFLVKHSYLFNTVYYWRKAARDPDVSNYYQFVQQAYFGPLWAEQKKRLKNIRDFVEARQGRLLVVTFPFIHLLGVSYPYTSIHEKLDNLWKELHVSHLDLFRAFKNCRAGDLVVNRRDAHPNERAHEIAANAILSFLEKCVKEIP
jgi:hypothetical protein